MPDQRFLLISQEEMCEAVAFWLNREVFQTSKAWDVSHIEVRGSTAPAAEREMFKISLRRRVTEDTNVESD